MKSTYVILSEEELYHHGILGMKWGKRNGPPYPLDAEDHSSSERKAGWRKSLGGGRNEESYSTNKKKAAKKAAKKEYKERNRKINENVGDIERRIESKYKRGKKLSEKDALEIYKADKAAEESWRKSKEQYKADIKAIKSSSDYKILTSEQRKQATKKAATIGATVAIAGLGVYGAYKFKKFADSYNFRSMAKENVERQFHDDYARAGMNFASINRSINSGKTSCLRVFDNLTRYDAFGARESNRVTSQASWSFVSNGEMVMRDISTELFEEWRYKGPYAI